MKVEIPWRKKLPAGPGLMGSGMPARVLFGLRLVRCSFLVAAAGLAAGTLKGVPVVA